MLPTKEQVQTAYTSAPDYVQDFITSEELDEAFTAIRREHKLHLDDAGRLSIAINAVILEIFSLEKFPQLVQEALTDVSSEIQKAVITEVNEQIFEELREWARLDKEGLLYEEEEISANTTPSDGAESESFREKNELPTQTGRGTVNGEKDTPVAQTPEIKTETSNKIYPGSDPYREPIE